MGLIQFVQNYDDLSTDRGYQFKFYCDRCGNGHMSRFEASVVGTAGTTSSGATEPICTIPACAVFAASSGLPQPVTPSAAASAAITHR